LKQYKDFAGKKLISNTLYLFIDWFVSSVLAFLFWFILGKTMNPFEVGIVSTSNNFVVFISIITTFGLIVALKKLVPEIKQKHGIKGVHSLIKLSLKPFFITLMAIIFILLIFSKDISSIIKLPFEVFIISLVSIIFYSIFEIVNSIFIGMQNMKVSMLRNISQMSLRIVLTIILILYGLSYFGPLLAFLLGYIFISFLRFDFRCLKSKTNIITIKNLFSYSFPALIATLFTSLILNGQYIILSIIKNPEVTGIFTIAAVITSLITVFSSVINSAFFPMLSGMSSIKGMGKRQGYMMGLVIRYTLFLIIPASILLLVFSRFVIIVFSSEQFLLATQFFPMLVPAAILSGIGTIMLMNLYAIGKPQLHMKLIVLSSVIFLILAVGFTNLWSAIGLTLAILITMLIRFSFGFGYITRFIKIKFFSRDFLKILFSSSLITLLLYFSRPFLSNIFVLILYLIPVGIVYLILLYIFRFYREEDVKILNYFEQRVPIFGRYIRNIINLLEKRLNRDSMD